MKIIKSMLCVISVFVILILAGIWAIGEQTCVAQESEEIWGTWVTTEKPKGYSLHVSQKRIFSPDGMVKFYRHEYRQSPEFEGTYAITEKWTDSEGNIWYKMKMTGESIRYGGKVESYLLARISDSGKTLEYVYHPLDYHKNLDPNHPGYRIAYRK